jgi:hypothetical protein
MDRVRKNPDGSESKYFGLPDLRDIDWEFFYYYMEARGFSRFSNQLETDVFKHDVIEGIPTFLKNDKGERIHNEGYSPRELLRKNYTVPQGIPLFEYQAKGIIYMGARRFGKSFWSASLILYEFLFGKNKGDVNEIIVGAFSDQDSSTLLKKVKKAMENLEGGYTEGVGRASTYYPSPIYKKHTDNWKANSSIQASYQEQEGNNWVIKGNGDQIHHRIFKDKHDSANGLSAMLMIYEEIGKFDNLEASYNSSLPCFAEGSYQFGVPLLLGTGGDMDKGTKDAKKMFYNPSDYNLLEFYDEWEHNSKPIGMFIPAYYGDNKFKIEGITTHDTAKAYYERLHEKKAKGSATVYNQTLQYYPLKPSHTFLSDSGNIFPQESIRRQIVKVELERIEGTEVELLFTQKAAKVEEPTPKQIYTKQALENPIIGAPKPPPKKEEIIKVPLIEAITIDKNFKYIKNFPVQKHESKEGAIYIWEKPILSDGRVPHSLYIAGIDSYDKAVSTTDSLGSTLIYRRFSPEFMDTPADKIVAEYTGRPGGSAEIYYENVRRLLFYYNAVAMLEYTNIAIETYFRNKNSLHLLADVPKEVLTGMMPNSKLPQRKGMPMTTEVKSIGIGIIRDWLMENDEYNIQHIHSIPLLQELLEFNLDGNFDRTMSLMMILFYKMQLFKHKVRDAKPNRGFGKISDSMTTQNTSNFIGTW